MAKLPLEDITILEIGDAWAGPIYAQIMADMGATVIKIEYIERILRTRGFIPPTPPDHFWPGYRNCKIDEPTWEVGGTHHRWNRNKYGITLDLYRPKGREVCKRLVRKVDVLYENNPPGRMQNWGLGYSDLKEINPGLIMVSNTGWGSTGPEASYKAWGVMMEPMSGLASFTGYPEPEPIMKCGFDYGDVPITVIAVGLTLAALHYRRKTGKGQFIDLSQREGVMGLVGEAVVGYSMNQTNPPRIGNHHSAFAPYNVYPAKSGPHRTLAYDENGIPELDEHWVAIAVRTDEEWKALCHVMGNPVWTKDKKFSTALSRWLNQDEMDRYITEWTEQHEMYEIMSLLQKENVPAGGVFDTRDLFEDPHLKARDFWIEHPEHQFLGVQKWEGMFCKLSKTPGSVRMPAPLLGQHNEYIYKEILGMSDEEYDGLLRDRYIGFKPLALDSPQQDLHDL